jgi:hypothetical protein
MTTITLNIGLETNDGTPAHEPIAVLQWLTENGFFARASRTQESATEYTLIVIVDPVPASVIYAASIALKQDCIAVSPDNGITGALIGPKSDAWGWTFNPEYFISA